MPATMYYTTAYKDVRPYMPADPVMVSAASCVRVHRDGTVALLVPRIPEHVTELAADCGGYAAAMRWNGHYPFTVRQYIRWLSRWTPRPAWAAMFDLPCIMAGKGRRYPGAVVVHERQRFTTEQAKEMWACHHLATWSWVPTIQGFYPEEYAAHARQLLPLIAEMFATTLEPACSDSDFDFDEGEEVSAFRVGIGSLCGASPALVREIVRQVQAVIGSWIPVHLWGWKLQGLQQGDEMFGVISYDTGAFNGRFNEEGRAQQRMSGKVQARYLWEDAQPAYKKKIEEAQSRPMQSSIFPLETTGYMLPRISLNDEEENPDTLLA